MTILRSDKEPITASVNQPEHYQDYPEAEVDELRSLEEDNVAVGAGGSQKADVCPHLGRGQLILVFPANCSSYKNVR